MPVVTRFAPSPTGFLHIGAARTALFSWLFARHAGGRFLLRIEDTDRARSTEEAVRAIFTGLSWLGLDWDGPPVFQSARADRHVDAARQLLDRGHAYRCYATPDELTAMRAAARAEKRPMRYDGRWRDRDPSEAPAGVEPVIRLKAPQSGQTTIQDLVQGEVTVANDQLDDMVLLRADGTPTYMLAVVVDDHDMDVTHAIRGDDHLTNAFRQTQLYHAFGWTPPEFAHIPLIHGADGAKLSKRHGAIGLGSYGEDGFLADAVFNYLLRLGWGHGDDEIISRPQAIRWFDLANVGRSPARFDADRLLSLNAHYLRETDDRALIGLIGDRLSAIVPEDARADDADRRLLRAIGGVKVRSRTLDELARGLAFFIRRSPIPIDDTARALLTDAGREHLARLADRLKDWPDWTADGLERAVRGYIEAPGDVKLRLRDVAQPLRAGLTGSMVSPPIFDVMEILGPDETLERIAIAVRQPVAGEG
jgi:glutamyl-tRNA synthetase